MRDALLKGCTHSTEASRPQPSGYTPIIAQNIVWDFGVGDMGRREIPPPHGRGWGSVAWAVEIPPPLGVGGVGDMGRKPMWTTIDDDGDGHMMMTVT